MNILFRVINKIVLKFEEMSGHFESMMNAAKLNTSRENTKTFPGIVRMISVLDKSLLFLCVWKFFLCFLAQRGENTNSGLVCVSHEATCWSSLENRGKQMWFCLRAKIFVCFFFTYTSTNFAAVAFGQSQDSCFSICPVFKPC